MNPKVIIVSDPTYKWRLLPYAPNPDCGEFGKAMKILERAGIAKCAGDWVFEDMEGARAVLRLHSYDVEVWDG